MFDLPISLHSLFFAVGVLLIQVVFLYAATLSIRRKYEKFSTVHRKHQIYHDLIKNLDESVDHLKILEKIHLLNDCPKLSIEIQKQMGTRWRAIEQMLAKCLTLNYGDKHKFALLSIQGAFDLYHQTQNDFLSCSAQGQKGTALHLQGYQAPALLDTLKTLLESGKKLGNEGHRTELKTVASGEVTDILYPSLALLATTMMFLGWQLLPA